MIYSMGNRELNELVGGFEPGTMVVVEGVPGAGKTTLALSIAYSNMVLNKSRVLYLVFGETPEKLIMFSKRLGLTNIEEFISKGMLKLSKIPLVNDIELIDYTTKILSESTNKYDIVIIDSVTPLMKLLQSYQAKRTWIQMIYDFISRFSDGLLILVSDSMGPNDVDLRMIEFVADVVIELDFKLYDNGFMERFIRIKKFRGRCLRVSTIPFVISRRGILVLNYISEELLKQVKPHKKPIKITCKPLQELFNTDTLEPGTQILIIDKRGWVHGSRFLGYIIHMLYNLYKEGYNIGVTSSNPEVLSELKKIILRGNYTGPEKEEILQKLKIREIDLRTTNPQYILSEAWLTDMSNDIDLFISLGLEKMLYIYGFDILKNTNINVIEGLRELGITTIRYIRLEDEKMLPQYFIEFHDIVVAIETAKDGATVIRMIKNIKARGTIEIPDIEFRECLRK